MMPFASFLSSGPSEGITNVSFFAVTFFSDEALLEEFLLELSSPENESPDESR
jgi:hypothetical protein